MRHRLVLALVTLSLTAAPAFAQSADQNGSPNQATQNPSAGGMQNRLTRGMQNLSGRATQNQSTGGAQNQAAGGQSANGMETPAALEQSLEQSGFKDVRVSATSYVVHATGPNGSPIVMMITPDRVTGVIGHPVLGNRQRGNDQSAQAPNGASENGGSDQQQNGNQQ